MPSINAYKNSLTKIGTSVGDAHLNHSNMVMEATWDSDIQSKVCYIYDYLHDDKPSLAHNITHEYTTKTKIDAKFIVFQYGSISKDQVAYHLMFRPSQPVSFKPGDDLYYYETDYRNRYGMNFPIGLFIDVPDENKVYHKWLIVAAEHGNQFAKYSILPCDYYAHWIEVVGNKRVKRKMWCAQRQQSSYNSGLWLDQLMTSQENQMKLWYPLNPITEKIYYTHENSVDNQRMIISAPISRPITWQVSKVENTKPIGINCLTFTQDVFNPKTDYVNLETGEMYADYYALTPEPEPEKPQELIRNISCEIKCNAATIKCGGSYKKLTALFRDANGNDITDECAGLVKRESWTCSIDGKDVTTSELVTWLTQTEPNVMKLKFANDKSYLTKVLKVRCDVLTEIGEVTGETNLEIVAI